MKMAGNSRKPLYHGKGTIGETWEMGLLGDEAYLSISSSSIFIAFTDMEISYRDRSNDSTMAQRLTPKTIPPTLLAPRYRHVIDKVQKRNASTP
jgi:hypothetical protein